MFVINYFRVFICVFSNTSMHAVTLFYMLNLMNSLLNNLVKKFADFQINLRAKHFVKHILVLS